MKGLRLGDLCAETGHFLWALKVWRLTARLIESKDWDDWIDVHFNPKWYDLQDVISETEYEMLLKRCGDLKQALGFPEDYWWTMEDEHYSSRYFGLHAYYWLFAEKNYGYYFFDDPEEYEGEMRELRNSYLTEKMFLEGQCDHFPLGSLSFTEYWHESSKVHVEDLSWFVLGR